MSLPLMRLEKYITGCACTSIALWLYMNMSQRIITADIGEVETAGIYTPEKSALDGSSIYVSHTKYS